MDILDGIAEQSTKILIIIRDTGGFGTIGAADFLHFTQNHIRVLYEVAVHFQPVGVCTQVYPIRFPVNESIPFLQEDDVGSDFCTCGVLEGVVGKSNGSQKFSSLGNVFADSRILLVHCSLGSDEGDDAAGSDLIQGAGKEIIVDEEIMLVIPLV